MALPFSLYQTVPAPDINIPVQQNSPTLLIDYTKGSSQIMMVTISSVVVGDVIEADAAVGISINSLPYNCVVGFSIVFGSGYWGPETTGEDIGQNQKAGSIIAWRPYYMPKQTVIYTVTAPAVNFLVAARIYAGTYAVVRPGDHCQTLMSNGVPTGHLNVKRYHAA